MRLIEKKTLHEDAANRLRDMILTGMLKEGKKINENEICESLGISKTPLREALRVLSSEGLIQLVPNHGAWVYKPTFDEIMEMFDVMIVLEGLCARSATEQMNEKDFLSLETLHRRLEEKYELKDQEGYLRCNNQYHTFLQKLARNRTLNQIINGLRKKILLYRLKSLSLPERLDQSIKEHRELLEAFRKRNAEKAETLMRIHLKNQKSAFGRLKN